MRKLGLTSLAALVRYAVRNNLVTEALSGCVQVSSAGVQAAPRASPVVSHGPWAAAPSEARRR